MRIWVGFSVTSACLIAGSAHAQWYAEVICNYPGGGGRVGGMDRRQPFATQPACQQSLTKARASNPDSRYCSYRCLGADGTGGGADPRLGAAQQTVGQVGNIIHQLDEQERAREAEKAAQDDAFRAKMRQEMATQERDVQESTELRKKQSRARHSELLGSMMGEEPAPPEPSVSMAGVPTARGCEEVLADNARLTAQAEEDARREGFGFALEEAGMNDQLQAGAEATTNRAIQSVTGEDLKRDADQVKKKIEQAKEQKKYLDALADCAASAGFDGCMGRLLKMANRDVQRWLKTFMDKDIKKVLERVEKAAKAYTAYVGRLTSIHRDQMEAAVRCAKR